jgi:hypothetical protein
LRVALSEGGPDSDGRPDHRVLAFVGSYRSFYVRTIGAMR